ncbi:hypothetical protein ACWCXX_40120 [Streptomyces sp. NPDC001732]
MQEPRWPEVDWGYINETRSVTIRAIGLTLVDTVISSRDELVAFDRAIAQWKHLLRDWLAVIAEGPTDFIELGQGETLWAASGHNDVLLSASYHAGAIHEPYRTSRWQWSHALEHTSSDDKPSLSRVLLTTAMRAAATGERRLALIDAATAAEVALTNGITARLSTQYPPLEVRARIERARMLGPRMRLAEGLGMTLPARIRDDLLKPRNSVVHSGTDVSDSSARAAIAVVWELIDEYDPMPHHCQEPFEDGTCTASP